MDWKEYQNRLKEQQAKSKPVTNTPVDGLVTAVNGGNEALLKDFKPNERARLSFARWLAQKNGETGDRKIRR